MKLKVHYVILTTLVIVASAGLSAGSETKGQAWLFDQKLAVPQSVADGQIANAFEKQFKIDTKQTVATRRSYVVRKLPLGAAFSKSTIRVALDLSDWPVDLRASARMWIAIGANSAISSDGSLQLTYSQNGMGMSTELNSQYNTDGTMIMGCDYALADAEVTIEVENRTHFDNVFYTVYAIIYLPEKNGVALAEGQAKL